MHYYDILVHLYCHGAYKLLSFVLFLEESRVCVLLDLRVLYKGGSPRVHLAVRMVIIRSALV